MLVPKLPHGSGHTVSWFSHKLSPFRSAMYWVHAPRDKTLKHLLGSSMPPVSSSSPLLGLYGSQFDLSDAAHCAVCKHIRIYLRGSGITTLPVVRPACIYRRRLDAPNLEPRTPTLYPMHPILPGSVPIGNSRQQIAACRTPGIPVACTLRRCK